MSGQKMHYALAHSRTPDGLFTFCFHVLMTNEPLTTRVSIRRWMIVYRRRPKQ